MAGNRVVVLAVDEGPKLPLVEGEGQARAVIWPGNGGNLRTLAIIDLVEGSSTVRLSHPGEAVYYVETGQGNIECDDDSGELREGAIVHIDGGTGYEFHAGAGGVKLVGGPSPSDPSLYEGIEALQ